MTWRAVLAGLLGGAFVCGFTHFNDTIMRQTMFVGNNMPISVYGGLIVFILLVNPLFGRRAFTGGELAVALALILAVCCIPGSGLMRLLPADVMFPFDEERTTPGWRESGVVKMASAGMLASPGRKDEALDGFVRGLGTGRGFPNPALVPWQAWSGTLAFWLPLLLLLWVGLIALAVVVHRQWSEHEHLRYPVAMFSDALLPGQGGRWGPILENRLFWLGAGAVFLLYLNNYLTVWFPSYLVQIPTQVDLSPLEVLVPTYMAGNGWWMFTLRIYFTVVAFGFFLASDVSLAMGLGPCFYPWVVGTFAAYGISITNAAATPSIENFMNFGAYFGILLVILYTGRHYYGRTLRRALLVPTGGTEGAESVWGARVFMLCATLITAYLIFVAGLNWPMAIIFTGLVFMLFLVIARISAETGAFMIQPVWAPGAVLWGIFGSRALGPQQALIMLLLSSILVCDPREALMPYVVNSFKLLQMRRASIRRTAAWGVGALLIGLAVAVPVTLTLDYDRGVDRTDWSVMHSPFEPFTTSMQIQQRLSAQGNLKAAEAARGWRRFAAMSPDPSCLIGFAAGLGLVLAFAAARLRLPKWPLHPILFLVWSSWGGRMLASSFLVGWAIKMLVTKYGGAAWYQRLKPLMFGLVAGEMLGGLAPMVAGFVYWLMTGQPPKAFNILPW